jgi:hypothetical protein
MHLLRVPRRRSAALAFVVLTCLATFAGRSSSIQAHEIVGPSARTDTQRAVSGELLAPPGPLDHWESPRIRISTDGWKRMQKEGGVSLEPSAIWDLEVSEQQAVAFVWSARPKSGQGEISGYRWALDIEDITDETPRADDDDLAHWSAWSLDETSATVGPFAASQDPRFFYVEARDTKGFVSLVTIRMQVVSTSDGGVEIFPLARR